MRLYKEHLMNKHSHWLSGIAIFIGLINLLLAFMFFRLIEVTADVPSTERGYTIEALALQITILEMVVGLFLAGLGIVGFFGYVGIKNAATKKAEDAAERIAAEKMASFIQQQGGVQNLQAPTNVQTVPIVLEAPKDGTKAGNE